MSRSRNAEAQLREIIASQPGSNSCADCGSNYPKWASHNLGVFLCVRCAGIHRKIGTHVSKIKSISLDFWADDQIENVRRWGNKRANEFYNPTPSRYPMPLDALSDETYPVLLIRNNLTNRVMERYIRDKYEHLKFQERHAPSSSSASAPPPRPPKRNDKMSADFQSELQSLAEMGFMDEQKNLDTLKNNNGDVNLALEALLHGSAGGSAQASRSNTPSVPARTTKPTTAKSESDSRPSAMRTGGKPLSAAEKKRRKVHFEDGVVAGEATDNEDENETRVKSPTLNPFEQMMALQGNASQQNVAPNQSVQPQLTALPPDLQNSPFFTAPTTMNQDPRPPGHIVPPPASYQSAHKTGPQGQTIPAVHPYGQGQGTIPAQVTGGSQYGGPQYTPSLQQQPTGQQGMQSSGFDSLNPGLKDLINGPNSLSNLSLASGHGSSPAQSSSPNPPTDLNRPFHNISPMNNPSFSGLQPYMQSANNSSQSFDINRHSPIQGMNRFDGQQNLQPPQQQQAGFAGGQFGSAPSSRMHSPVVQHNTGPGLQPNMTGSQQQQQGQGNLGFTGGQFGNAANGRMPSPVAQHQTGASMQPNMTGPQQQGPDWYQGGYPTRPNQSSPMFTEMSNAQNNYMQGNQPQQFNQANVQQYSSQSPQLFNQNAPMAPPFNNLGPNSSQGGNMNHPDQNFQGFQQQNPFPQQSAPPQQQSFGYNGAGPMQHGPNAFSNMAGGDMKGMFNPYNQHNIDQNQPHYMPPPPNSGAQLGNQSQQYYGGQQQGLQPQQTGGDFLRKISFGGNKQG